MVGSLPAVNASACEPGELRGEQAGAVVHINCHRAVAVVLRGGVRRSRVRRGVVLAFAVVAAARVRGVRGRIGGGGAEEISVAVSAAVTGFATGGCLAFSSASSLTRA